MSEGVYGCREDATDELGAAVGARMELGDPRATLLLAWKAWSPPEWLGLGNSALVNEQVHPSSTHLLQRNGEEPSITMQRF